MFNYGQFLYGMPKGNIFQVKIDGITNSYDPGLGDVVEPNEGAIRAAVNEFQHPDVKAAENTGSVVLHKRIGAKSNAPKPWRTTVSVMNANGIAGSAGLAVDGLDKLGYKILYPPNEIPADAPQGTCPRQYCFKTQIFWNPAKKRSKAAATKIGGLFGQAEVQKLPERLKNFTNGSMVLVGGRARPSTARSRPRRSSIRRRSRRRRSSTTRTRRGACSCAGSARCRSSSKCRRSSRSTPSPTPRVCRSAPTRSTATTGPSGSVLPSRTAATPSTGECEETNWTDAPVLSDANFDQTIKGRHYRFYWNGSDLHMIALYENGATYWVVNTLLDSLSPSTMTAIAKGLKPLDQVKK